MHGLYTSFVVAGVVFCTLTSLGSIAEMARYEHSHKEQGQIVFGFFLTSVFWALLANVVL